MKFSRVGTLVLILITAILGANCSYYNRVMARKNLVDGAKAYKGRNFEKAEDLFRQAIARDPDADTIEGQTAQLFLARTIHSEYIGNRGETALAETAIEEYKKVLAKNLNDNSSFKAIANLLENLGKDEEAFKWKLDRANNEAVPPDQRAEALTSLAAKENTCANDITDQEPVKKTVTKGEIAEFVFNKPEDEEVYSKLQKCIEEGTKYIDRAVQLEPDNIKNPGSIDIKPMDDAQLRELMDLDKKFQSAWSYKASLLVQKMRVADMNDNAEEEEKFKKEAESARSKFEALNELEKKIQDEQDARKQAEAEKANKKK